MNAPENIATINAAHGVLLNAKGALSVMEVAQAIGASKPTAQKQLKELAGLGLIEMEPRAGGTPFYRLIVAGAQRAPEIDETHAAAGAEGGDQIASTEPDTDMGNPITGGAPLDFALSPELQYLAPEDYEMPLADPKLLAMANRELSAQLEEAKTECARLKAENVALKTLNEAMPGFGAEHQEQRIDSLTKDVINTRAALTKAINEADRLRLELFEATKMKAPAVGYLVRATKRKPRYITKPESAQAAALAAVRAGAARADVLALVPVGVARRGAEWQGIKPTGKGD